MALNQNFKEFIALLNGHNVRYLIVGGYAVAFHGHPRYTKDLVVWISPDTENLAKFLKALDQFGFDSLGLREEDFMDPDEMIQLGIAPNRIDLFTALRGVEFDTCYQSRIAIEIDDVTACVIDLQNLRRNKTVSGRPQDLADLSNLE